MVKAVWWLVTLVLAVMMGASGVACLMEAPAMVASMQHLGYPHYMLFILGTAKVLGVLALLLPVPRGLREWAYAGFTFNMLGALWSHHAAGDTLEIMEPAMVGLGLVQVSYWLNRLRRDRKAD
jgi:uncharacterized membrane protein YphA (DoxX/SURF4 family)